MPCNDCVWSQRALFCLQAPSAPAEEPLTEPINQDLDVSHAVVDASYRRVKLLHVRLCMDCRCLFYRTTCSQGKLTSQDLSTPSVAACSIHRIDAMQIACSPTPHACNQCHSSTCDLLLQVYSLGCTKRRRCKHLYSGASPDGQRKQCLQISSGRDHHETAAD